MKKMVALMLALAIMFTLGACGGGRKDLVENAEIWSEALTAKLLEAMDNPATLEEKFAGTNLKVDCIVHEITEEGVAILMPSARQTGISVGTFVLMATFDDRKDLEAISINDDITIAGAIAIVKTENDGIGIGVTPCYLVENRGTNAAWASVN